MSFFGKTKDAFNYLFISKHPLPIEEHGRRMLFVTFQTLISIALVFTVYNHFKHGRVGLGVMNIVLTAAMILLMVIVRYLKNASVLYRITTIIVTGSLTYWIITGASAAEYGTLWITLIPIYTFYLLGKKEGMIWTALFAGVIFIAVAINPAYFFSVYAYPEGYYPRLIAVCIMVLLTTYRYESSLEAYKKATQDEQSQLQSEKQKLILSKEETENANLLLKNEMRLRRQMEDELRKHRDHLEEIVAQRTREIKNKTDELEASEIRYRLVTENITDLIWTTDIHLNFTYMSPAIYPMFGYTVEEALKLTVEKMNTPKSLAKIIDTYNREIALLKTQPRDASPFVILQLDQVRKDGAVFRTEAKISYLRDINGRETGFVGITRDISDRIILEKERDAMKDQLAQSQKMEALGTLVGGLAHDFNNLLTGISGTFNLISLLIINEKMENKEEIERYLRLGMEASKRSAGLINQLLMLSRKHEIKPVPIDLRASIKHIHDLCKNSFPKSIELAFLVPDEPLTIMGDMVQIEQVLLNICINASHAMTLMRPEGAKREGALTLRTEKVSDDDLGKIFIPETDAPAGPWIKIMIADTGVGMDGETRRKIFEPFFSTKDKNQSTGLGLAISYNIIKKHGGFINVDSGPGRGSSFSLYFPSHLGGETALRAQQDQDVIRGGGTILVIDDETFILDIAEAFLNQSGYDVITAHGADRGIEKFIEHQGRISAVIVDQSMPGKSGLEVCQILKQIAPGVKVILSSGMLDQEAALKLGIRDTIDKPYTAAELSAKVKSAIDGQ